MDVLKTYVSPTRQGRPAELKGKAAEFQRLQVERYGIRRLVSIFAAWKLLLLVIACTSPGPGYDTSTTIFLAQSSNGTAPPWISRALELLGSRLTRWDGLYFASASLQGKVYEQEWAFSWALSRANSAFTRVFLSMLPLPDVVKHALAGILVSHLFHLAAVVALYYITHELIPASNVRKQATAFTAAVLHVVSPAGLFLSAPYGESTFAFFNFAGALVYLMGTKCYASLAFQQQRVAGRWFILSGILCGVAAMIRSNGLFSGIPFAWDAAITLIPWRKFWRQRDPVRRWKLAMIVVSGSFIAVGFALPQVVAYREYCTDGNTRTWCDRLPPSIYSWVQSHYWGVGFMKYWTLNNLPLFLLAAPMLAMLLWTGYIGFWRGDDLAALAISGEGKKHDDFNDTQLFTSVLARLAVPQILLAVLATTSFHVQIINRISSGYAVWYIVLAIAIQGEPSERARLLGAKMSHQALEWLVRVMIIYAMIQGGLFACFLPPA